MVLFVDDEVWGTFTHLAIALRRAGCAPVRVASTPVRATSRLISALFYDEVVRVDRPEGVRRLAELKRSGRIVDVQVNERSWTHLDPQSPTVTLLRSVPAKSRLALIDKVAAANLIRPVHPHVPELLPADATTIDEAVNQLGLPLMVKRRVGTSGSEVRLAADRDEVAAAVANLGGDLADVFFQRYVTGVIVGYAAAMRDGETLQECAAFERKSANDRFGPCGSIVTIDDPELWALGRAITAELRCEGLVTLEFVRDSDGRYWFIDGSSRAFGNMLAFSRAGIDLRAGYTYALDADVPRPTRARSENDVEALVFPKGLYDAAETGSVRRAVSTWGREMRHYFPRVGGAYCGFVTLRAAQTLARSRLR